MANYDEIITQANEHRIFLLEQAEQARLAQALPASQPHPIKAWLGRQLVVWGQQLQGEKPLPPLDAPAMTAGR